MKLNIGTMHWKIGSTARVAKFRIPFKFSQQNLKKVVILPFKFQVKQIFILLIYY